MIARLRRVEGYRRVSVFYPRGIRTGGPEALHQLVDELRASGHDAALVPLPGFEDSDRVAAYDRYDAPEVAAPATGSRDAVVVPEVWIPPRAVLGEATHICWWLSVDNSPLFMDERRREQARAGMVTSPPRSLRARVRAPARRLLAPVRQRRLSHAVHVAQSVYAQQQVRERWGGPVRLLSDYTVLDGPHGGGLLERLDPRDVPTVAFNPAKGGVAVAEVQRMVTRPVRWLPIAGMTPEEVGTALARSSVYLDLGHLPGKDRLPREAALSGAVTLLAAIGAGGNEHDFPLPDDHRIPAGPHLAREAATALERVLDDLPRHWAAQAGFRTLLGEERATFQSEVAEIFGEGPLS